MAKTVNARKMIRKSRKKTDRCRPLRENVARLQEMIRRVREDLSEPDIPPVLRRKLERLLALLPAQLRQAQTLLRHCEALPQM